MKNRDNRNLKKVAVYPAAPAWVSAADLWQRTIREVIPARRRGGRIAPLPPARAGEQNPNHHLWKNNGTWFMNCTVYPSRCTKERLRYSLETKSVQVARARRDAVFAALAAQGLLSTHGHARASLAGTHGMLH